jgi:hypothetical protein
MDFRGTLLRIYRYNRFYVKINQISEGSDFNLKRDTELNLTNTCGGFKSCILIERRGRVVTLHGTKKINEICCKPV